MSSSTCARLWRGQKTPGTHRCWQESALLETVRSMKRVGGTSGRRFTRFTLLSPSASRQSWIWREDSHQRQNYDVQQGSSEQLSMWEGKRWEDRLWESVGRRGTTTDVTWRLPGNMRPDKATHGEHGGGKSRRLMG